MSLIIKAYKLVSKFSIDPSFSRMCMEVPFVDGKNLFDVLWNPRENGLKTSGDLLPYLNEAVPFIVKNPDKLTPFNPTNIEFDYGFLRETIIYIREMCMKDKHLVLVHIEDLS